MNRTSDTTEKGLESLIVAVMTCFVQAASNFVAPWN